MTGTARVHDEDRLWKGRHQRACPSGMIEVDVSEDDPPNVPCRKPALPDRRQDARHAAVDTGVNERRLPLIDDEVAGIQPRPDIAGVDGEDARPDGLTPVCCVQRSAPGLSLSITNSGQKKTPGGNPSGVLLGRHRDGATVTVAATLTRCHPPG